MVGGKTVEQEKIMKKDIKTWAVGILEAGEC